MTIIQRYQIVTFVMGFAIGILVYQLFKARRKLRGKDMDGKIKRCRRAQRRMEQHPKRVGGPE